MPTPKRIAKMTYVLVPQQDTARLQEVVHTARRTCRVAHTLGLKPMSPLLYFLTFLAPGEFSMEMRRLFYQWLIRADRIWLQFHDPNVEVLDPLSYDILADNQRSRERRPVYQIHQAGDDFHPIPMTYSEVDEILKINLTAGLARACI